MSCDYCKEQVEAATERMEITEAQLALVSQSLAGLLAFVDRIGGYTEPDDQHAIRMARIALAEVRR